MVSQSATSAFGVPIGRMSNLSDEDIIERIRQGHTDALSILFDRFYRLVIRIAMRILRDPGEAEDLMQDVFLEVFKKAALFDRSKGSAKTWILQYAYHRSLSRRHYLALRNFYDRRQISESEVFDSDSGDTFWRGLTFAEWRPVIEQGLATLNQKQRKTLELACFEGLLLIEIAERTKESLPNVRHHYYRGVEGLRRFLHQRRAEEPRRKSHREANDDEC